MCAMVEQGSANSREPAWAFATAICSALSGEFAEASAQIDVAKARFSAGIDGLLAEKVVGAGIRTRRAVVIQWVLCPCFDGLEIWTRQRHNSRHS